MKFVDVLNVIVIIKGNGDILKLMVSVYVIGNESVVVVLLVMSLVNKIVIKNMVINVL